MLGSDISAPVKDKTHEQIVLPTQIRSRLLNSDGVLG